MKKCYSVISIVGLVCACLTLIGCGTTQPGAATAPPPNSGTLVVDRVANFGSGLGLVLSIDGKDVATLTEGQHYHGYLAAGQHRLTGRVDPFQAGTRPAQKTLTIQAGQTYSYTAAWSGQSVRFVKNP
jgi:hypothetical protein